MACKVTSVNYDYRDHTGIYTYNQYADTVALTIDTRTLELTPQCIYPEIYTLTMTPEIDADSSQDLFYSMSGQTVTVETHNLHNHGLWNFAVTFELDTYEYNNDATGVLHLDGFQVKVQDPCYYTDLQEWIGTDHLHAIIGQGPFRINYQAYNDTISQTYDHTDLADDSELLGYVLCGERNYTLMEVIVDNLGIEEYFPVYSGSPGSQFRYADIKRMEEPSMEI